MRTCATILCVLAVLFSTGLADDISVKGFTYSGVTIVGVKDGVVTFKIVGGRTQSKPFSEITGMSITGLDSFNKAEQLMSGTAQDSEAEKLRRESEAKKDSIAKIKLQIGDQPKEVARLNDEAKGLRLQAEADKKRAEQITGQIADINKSSADSGAQVAQFKREVVKLAKEARAIELAKKGDWKNQAAQRRNQAKNLLKKIDELDVVKIKYHANKKRAEAKKLQREAQIIERAKKKGWQNQSKQRKNQANTLNREAGDLENKANRLDDANTKGRARIAALITEKGTLLRQVNLALRKAASLEARAKAFPKTAASRNEKLIMLERELDEIEKKLKALASAPKINANRFSPAIRAYEAAAALKTSDHAKAIINYRLLNALDQSGWIDQAASKWLQLADRENGAAGVIACCPNKLGDKGDPRNAKAISILGARVRGIKDGKYQAAALELLGRLLQQEGRGAEIITWLPKTAATGPKLVLLKAVALFGKKEYTQAEGAVTGVLHQLDRDSLPEALIVRGKAILAQADAETDKKKKRELMLKAGLDFMRVATFFRGLPRAGESLYLAGKIMATMPDKPNTVAAVNAYEAVAKNYAGTPIGQKAADALKAIKSRQ